MGDCRNGTCRPPVRYEAPQPTYQQPEQSCWQSAACDAYGRKGTTVVYDGQTKPQYKEMTDSFKFNGDKAGNEKGGVQDAYAEAIRTGKPLVVIMGKFDGNNPRNVVDQTQKNAKNDAVYLYVDPATCKDKELKEYAEQRLKGGHNASMTDVFEFTPGKNGAPEMKRVYSWQGGDPSMVASFKDALAKTHDNMTANKDKFSKEPMGPTEIEQKQIADAKAKEAAAKEAAAKEAAAKEAAAKEAAAKEAAAKEAAAKEAAAKEAAAKEAAAKEAAAKEAAAKEAARVAAERAAEIKAAEERGRAKGHKDAAEAVALVVAPGPVIAAKIGAKVAEEVAKDPVTAAKVAGVIIAPTVAIPAIVAPKVVEYAAENPGTVLKGAAIVAAPTIAIPVIVAKEAAPVVIEGAKKLVGAAEDLYQALPEAPRIPRPWELFK